MTDETKGVSGKGTSGHQSWLGKFALLDEDRSVSIKAICIQVGVGVATVHKIIHENLNMRKVCSQGAQ